jgi:hypothetical protein
MIYYLGVCTVYAQIKDDAPKSSAVTGYHDGRRDSRKRGECHGIVSLYDDDDDSND